MAGLMLAALWALRPFIAPAIWATTIVVATWPLLRRVQARLSCRRLPALLAMLLAALMYPRGAAAATLLRFGRRLAGVQGQATVVLAGQAICGVALSVGVTAVVQLEPIPVLLPAVAWLYWSGNGGRTTFLRVLILGAR